MTASAQPRIRRGEPADLPAVLALLRGAGLPTADLTGNHAVQMWVLEASASLVGVIALERFGAEGLLRSLAIAPDYRRRGLARELVVRIEQDSRANGIAQLVLLTQTAEPFFRSLGYDVLERSHVAEALKESAEFRNLCPASATCMRKIFDATGKPRAPGKTP
ncbi:MAG: arsenic resistance N-acetyltransferase ArsN2 [Steroidobacteraceae bacterium]